MVFLLEIGRDSSRMECSQGAEIQIIWEKFSFMELLQVQD